MTRSCVTSSPARTVIGAGWLSAPPPGAWHPRDQWLGWSDVARAENLHGVVNQRRFLIRAHLQVPNLASQSLTQVLQRLPAVGQARYGYGPVLVETFVERARFAEVSYAAAPNRSPHPRSKRKNVQKLAPQHTHGINQLPNARFLPPISKSSALDEFALP